MTDSNVLLALQNTLLAQVKFEGTEKLYTYKVPPYLSDLKVGDVCVVSVTNDRYPKFNFVTVISLGVAPNLDQPHKWLIDRVRMPLYEEVLKREMQITKIIQRARQARELEVRRQELEKFMTPDDLKEIKELLSKPFALEEKKDEVA